MAALLGIYFTGHSGDKVPYDVGIGILIVVCVFVSGFAYSWGPLAWLARIFLNPMCTPHVSFLPACRCVAGGAAVHGPSQAATMLTGPGDRQKCGRGKLS